MPQYNTVFERLVNGEEDLEGLVAYALYKEHKRTWLIKERQRLGHDPNDQETDAFIAGVLTHLDAYRLRASNSLISFGQQYVEEAREKVEREAVKHAVEGIAARVERSLSFGRALAFNMLSFIVIAIILSSLAFFAERTGNDLIDVFSRSGAPPDGITPD